MGDRATLPPFLADAVPGWLAARRFAVPASMVERATARRMAGDWRGACAAARFDVEVDLDDVRSRYGAYVADRVGTDLSHLAPDLIRWHLPREHAGGLGRILPDLPIVLARYHGLGGAVLWVHTPAHLERPPRPRLRFGLVAQDTAVRGERWDDARDLWDARAADGLRHRLNGGAAGSLDRTPFHHRDGRRLTAGELPSAQPGPDDTAALVEWVTLLLDAERTDDAWAAAGIAADLHPGGAGNRYVTSRLLVQRNPMVTSVAAEIRRLHTNDGPLGGTCDFIFAAIRSWVERVVVRARPDGVTAGVAKGEQTDYAMLLPRVTWQRFPDLELLRLGRLAPAGLHPLVRGALFPDGPEVEFRPDARVAVPDAVRVRCRGTWHRVGWRDGRVDPHDHPPEEAGRERTLRALGGPMAACVVVTESWTADAPGGADDPGRLPRRLRELRRDAAALIAHGDTDGFLALLDTGLDVTGLRNRRHRTPLHLAAHLNAAADPAMLVSRLVGAGLDVDATDAVGRTPLGTVLFDGGSAALVRALLDAGADPRVVDSWGCTPLHLMRSADAATILPWLLDAGLDLEGHDMYGRTPLMVQLSSAAPTETLRAMLAAGARRNVEDDENDDPAGEMLDDRLRRYRYDDVDFVRPPVVRVPFGFGPTTGSIER